MREARFYLRVKGDLVQCRLCPRNCVIENGKRGYCGVRENRGGKLYSLVFGKPCSIAIDPIEKKPFYHYIPGMTSLSIATVGCNLSCKFCQNWEISQTPKLTGEIYGEELSPEELARLAEKYGVRAMSWTYTEPTVFAEYFLETAKLTKGKVTHNWVTNGFTSPEVAKEVSKYIDAANVDYKGNDGFYRSICDAWLEPIREVMKIYKRAGVWLEITNLLIPGYNDSEDVIREMVEWIRDELGKEVPLHFSAYYPAYKFTAPPTPIETLEKAAKIADEYLDFVYLGNVRHERENTFCPDCGELLIERVVFSVRKFNLERKGEKFHCPNCGRNIPIAGTKFMT